MKNIIRDELGAPKIVDRSAFQAELEALRVRNRMAASSRPVRHSELAARVSRPRLMPSTYERIPQPPPGLFRREIFQTLDRPPITSTFDEARPRVAGEMGVALRRARLRMA
jgi:hypothetical protein